MNPDCSEYTEIPVLTLRDTVIFPHMIVPLFIGRETSIECIKVAMKKEKKIILVTQKNPMIENPIEKDLFNIGTLSKILNILKLPNGTIKIIIQSIRRIKINNFKKNNIFYVANFEEIKQKKIDNPEQEILIKILIQEFKKYIQKNKKISLETLQEIKKNRNLEEITDKIAENIPFKIREKQYFLEIVQLNKRVEYLLSIIKTELNLLKIEKKIRNRVKKQIEKSQKEYYLNEQMKAIQKELGEFEETQKEYEKLKKKIKKTKMPKYAKKKTQYELKKLKMISPISIETTVVRSYIDWIIKLPWKNYSKIKKDIKKAKEILDADHFGLDDIKERILEYLAVQNRSKKIKGPILCLVGPPGVGKTSLGKSIAKATGRKYIRMALGGIRDEAEIRGHRRTYIGSMPGKLIQKMTKVGVKNPLFLLDEIDKLSFDMRMDPAAALLEVLDSEQNFSFNDHYLEIDYDLSEVMFIATSNSMNIPSALLDRMEIIKLTGYTEEEKIEIAKKHLFPKQIKENSLTVKELEIDDKALNNIVRYYTREAGVRNLEREISKICRKIVKKLLINPLIKKITINEKNLKKYLGIKKYFYGKKNKKNQIGQVTGLAWTEVGGDLLTIESACISGKGKLIYTGSLGEVMQESIQTALTVVRSYSKKLKIQENFYEKKDIHVHVPEGATPKDGPSAGIAMCTSIVSCLTKNPVKSDIAMTGEITLRGKILKIGGLKEKIIAAHRGGIKTIIIPKENKRDLSEIPKNIITELSILTVTKIKEVLLYSLEKNPFI